MKKENIIKYGYWISTSILFIMIAPSAYTYLTLPEMIENFKRLGFPDYFRIELAFAKTIGVTLLLIPVGKRIKEWIYAGFFIVFVSAVIAHIASGDPISDTIPPIIALTLLIISYITYNKLSKN